MVEMLVAVLVVAIGIVGSLRLLASGLRETRSALWRTEATLLADDLAERMRANPGALDAYDPRRYPAGADPHACDGAGDCTPQQVAETDVAQWLDLVAARLPQRDAAGPGAAVPGNASVDVEPGAAGTASRVRIAIRWRDPAEVRGASQAEDLIIARAGPLP